MFNISTDEIEIHNICFNFFYKLYLYYSSKPLVKYIINCFIRGSPCIANYCIGQFTRLWARHLITMVLCLI